MKASLLTLDEVRKYGYCKLASVDHTLDDAQFETRCPLDNGRHHGQPKYGMGSLDRLPVEVLTEVLLGLDIPSLTAFRRVNRPAMNLVDAIPSYRAVFENCPNVLRAILSINAKHFDYRGLFQTLSGTKCVTCDKFGAYLYLITCKRVCYFCFTWDLKFFPVAAALGASHVEPFREELDSLPHVTALPGRYTPCAKLVKKKRWLFDRQSVDGRLSEVCVLRLKKAERRIDHVDKEAIRFMSVITAPYFTLSGRAAHWGYHCATCRDSARLGPFFRHKFTGDGFVDHMVRLGLNH